MWKLIGGEAQGSSTGGCNVCCIRSQDYYIGLSIFISLKRRQKR